MFCGTGSFSQIDEDEHSAPSTPKGSRRKRDKNPYASRGLDKFSTVLTELEARRERILATAGAQGVSMVRFMYSNSHDWVPIIVRLRDEQKQDSAKPADAKKPLLPPPETGKDSEVTKDKEAPPAVSASANEVAKRETAAEKKKKVKKRFSWGVREGEGQPWWRWRPCYYWPMVIVLILVCLVMFGRVFAICCTSIWWYLVPTMQGGSGDHRRRSVKKKEFGRRLSDKKLGANLVIAPSSQAKRVGGLQEATSPRNHPHVTGKRG